MQIIAPSVPFPEFNPLYAQVSVVKVLAQGSTRKSLIENEVVVGRGCGAYGHSGVGVGGILLGSYQVVWP